jgi:hypothetical protein
MEFEQALFALDKKLFEDDADETGRLPGGEREKLRRDLEKLVSSLEGKLGSEAVINKAIEDLNAIRLRHKAIELDEEQRRVRTEAARTLISELSAKGIASWRKELDRLEAELEKISGLPVDKSLFELQRLLEALREMEKLSGLAADVDIDSMKERRYVYAPLNKKTNEADSRARVITEIRDWADRIAMMDESEGGKLRPALDNLKADTQFPDRLSSLRDQLKAKWGTLRERAASTTFFREKLEELMDLLRAPKDAAGSREAAELKKRCKTLHVSKFIDRALFMALYEDVSRFAWEHTEEVTDRFFVKKVEETLAELGYELLTDESDEEEHLSPGRVRYLETPYDGYRLMLKVNEGAVSTRLVRVAESENETPAPDQRQKDVETGIKWCRDLDKFFEKMAEEDLPLDVTLRKDPEEVELMTVVDKNMRARKKKGKKARKGQGAEKMQKSRAAEAYPS